MPRRAASDPAAPALLPLTVNDQLMFAAYFSNGQNVTQAYLKVHPNAKYSTAESNGHKWLRKTKIVAELGRRLQVECGVTKQWGESTLLRVCHEAETSKDWALLAPTVMDAMKLAGFLVEKREIKTVTDDQRTALRDLVQSAMRTLSPTTRMGSPVADTSHTSSASPSLAPSAGTETERTN